MTDQHDDETELAGRNARPTTMDDALRHAPVGVIEVTGDGHVRDVNETAASVVETDRGALQGTDVRESFPKSAAGTLREAFDGDTVSDRSFVEYYPRIDRWLEVTIRVDDAVFVYVRDRTHERETERTVDRLEDRLERVQQIDALVSAVLQRVIDASGRVDVARTLCERLGGADLYRFAWVGEREFPADRLQVVASAGAAPDLRERIDETLDDETSLPGQGAVATGETQLVQAIAEDGTIPRGVRRAAFGHGLRSCLAVPLAYQGTVYGVVSVYSGQEDGFSEHERAGLETLGNIAGFAIRAIRQEDLLVADTVTRVTVDVRDETVPLVRAARAAGCRLSLDGAVPRGDGSVVCYLGTDGTTEGVDEALADSEGITDVRWVRSEQEPLLQATLVEETPVTTLVAWGATLSTAEYTADNARLVADAPPDGNVRRMVEAVDATVAETNLVAKEERTRDVESVEAFRDVLDEQLTDRQRTVLRTAHLSDYFASPRGSTSAEVAETLDIAGSTLLYHLRRAEQKLVETYFAHDRDTPTTTDT
jgi:hypothetical protein